MTSRKAGRSFPPAAAASILAGALLAVPLAGGPALVLDARASDGARAQEETKGPTVRVARQGPTTLIVPPERHTLGVYRVTNFHLKLFTGPGNRFRDPRGLACVKLRRTDDPRRAGDDDELTVYGVNSGEPSIIYNDTMASVKIWRGEMRSPTGIAADPNGRVVVADTGNDRILLLRNELGKLVLERAVGKRGSAPGEFLGPTGVALDSRARIYVADTGNHRIQILDPFGRPLSSIGGPAGAGLLSSPTAIAVVDRSEEWSFRHVDAIFVADRGGRRIQSFTFDGRLLDALEPTSDADPSFAFIALDYHNNLYATETARCRIHKLDQHLHRVALFGSRGDGDLQFEGPTGISIWRRLGQVFIAEKTGAQYYWIGTDIESLLVTPPSTVPGTPRSIAYRLTERSQVDVDVVDSADRIVREILRGAYQDTGLSRISWDGNDEARSPLPPGEYRVRVAAMATYSSRKHFRREEMRRAKVLSAEGRGD